MTDENPGKRILVTDGEQRAALAVVRSLGRAGHTVLVQSRRRNSLAGVSRYTAHELVMPGAADDRQSFGGRIADVVRHHGIDLVIPVTDPAMQCLLQARDQLVPATIPFAGYESYAALSDKAALMDRARRAGIAVPEQRRVGGRDELLEIASSLRFPLVLKPSCSVRASGSRLCKFNVTYANDRAELERHVATLDDGAFPLLVQERIVGDGVGAFFLMWDGVSLARFGHRRLRERPPSGGEMVYSEAIALDETLASKCEALLRDADWRGPAMVEFKIDRETGTPYLMEVNARFWGSLQLAIDAGVDFPALLVEAAFGKIHPERRAYGAGTRMRWFWGDVDHLAVRLLHSPTKLNMAPGWGGRLRAVRAFAETTMRRERDAIFRWDDPRPFVRESRTWVAVHARAAASRLGKRRTASVTPVPSPQPSPESAA